MKLHYRKINVSATLTEIRRFRRPSSSDKGDYKLMQRFRCRKSSLEFFTQDRDTDW
jgi:hypothetical protein